MTAEQGLVRERLLSAVEFEPNSGCWLWSGAGHPSGYGLAKYLGKSEHAHRTSYRAFKGEIPAGMLVCHRCDTGWCINPEHLFLGSYADNSADAVKKGRTARGETNGKARHTRTQIEEFRALANAGLTRAEIGRRYGMHPSNVGRILNGRRWKYAA